MFSRKRWTLYYIFAQYSPPFPPNILGEQLAFSLTMPQDTAGDPAYCRECKIGATVAVDPTTHGGGRRRQICAIATAVANGRCHLYEAAGEFPSYSAQQEMQISWIDGSSQL